MKRFLWLGLLAILLIGCNAAPTTAPAATTAPQATAPEATAVERPAMGMGSGMGRSSGMAARHHAAIPAEYAALSNPMPEDAESITRGAAVFSANCASCHGDGGMGDGPAAGTLNPAPAPLAHTSQMMGDNYLFWRVSEGGVPFDSAMPAWKEILSEQERWDVINYVQALGAGKVAPASQIGGSLYDPALQAAHQAEMLAQAVAQGVISQAEADTFALVHTALESYRADQLPQADGLTTDEREAAMLSALVDAGTITQAQAEAFRDIHDRLAAAGLMQ